MPLTASMEKPRLSVNLSHMDQTSVTQHAHQMESPSASFYSARDYPVEQSDEERRSLLAPFPPHKYSSKFYVWFVLVFVAAVGAAFGGYNSILAVYFHDRLGHSQNMSNLVVTSFISTTFVFSLLGGVLSDCYFDRFFVLVLGGMLYIAGSLLFLIPEILSYLHARIFNFNLSNDMAFPGVFLTAIGNGICVPVLSTFIGDQFSDDEQAMRSRFFAWFYWMVQVGSILTSVVLPIVLDNAKPVVVFGIIVSILALGLAIFLLGQSFYRKRPPSSPYVVTFVKVIWFGIVGKRGENDQSWLDKSTTRYGATVVFEVKSVLSMLLLYLPLPFFWAIYAQIPSYWVFMADDTDRSIWGWKIPPNEVVSLNPIMDVILIPLFSMLIYPLAAKLGFPLRPLQKMSMGLFFTSLSLVAAGLVQWAIRREPHGSVSLFWLIPQIFLISCGEITLAVTAYEFSYTQAPENMKGMLTACWSLTQSIGAMLTGLVSIATISNMSIAYFSFSGFIALLFIIFVVLAHKFQYRDEQEAYSSFLDDDGAADER